MKSFGYTGKRLLLLAAALLPASPAFAGGSFTLSKNADFSTNDRVFTRQDVLHMRVVAPEIDFTDIEDNEFRLKPDRGGDEVRGSFVNHFDGTYTARLPLATLTSNETRWEWRAEIEDDDGNEFEARVRLIITADERGASVRVQIRGTIERLGARSLVVRGRTIFVDAATEIIDGEGAPISFVDLRVGQSVEIQAERRDDGNLWALRIQVRARVAGDEVEIVGEIRAVAADHIVIMQFAFFVDEDTEILDNQGNPITLADLQPGQLVEVRARRQADGTLLAVRIKIQDRVAEEVELTGAIEELGENSLVVLGLTFVVDEQTVILDDQNVPISFADLQVGQVVQIRAERQADGTLLATRIKIEDRLVDEVEVTGAIEELGESSVVVLGFTFVVDDQTVILDDQNNAISFADLRLGQVVQIRGERQADGTLRATRVKIEDRVVDEIELVGTIEALTMDSIVVLGLTFAVDEQTVILDQQNDAITLADLRLGQVVQIRGERQADGTLRATRIKVEDRAADQLELTGAIEELGDNSLVVLGLTFVVDDQTVILDNQNNAISFADLQVGQVVEIRGERRDDGTLRATRIKIEDRVADEVELTGAIEALSVNSVVVLGITFVVDDQTVILDNQNNAISMADLHLGQIVQIRGERQADGTLRATRIKVEDRAADEVELTGAIEALSANSVVVLGIPFVVDDRTVILDNQNNPISLADLRLGQTVQIRGERQADGTWRATRIKVEDRMGIRGMVASISGQSFTVAGIAIAYDNQTEFSIPGSGQGSAEDLQVGVEVEVEATQEGAASLRAVHVMLTGNATSVETESPPTGATPTAFVLHANYPNPFNPSTTLRFEVPAAGDQPPFVTLKIYNVLGQVVRTLVNRRVAPGTHVVVWDGRTDAGERANSGVYFYELRSGTFSTVRRMVLAK